MPSKSEERDIQGFILSGPALSQFIVRRAQGLLITQPDALSLAF